MNCNQEFSIFLNIMFLAPMGRFQSEPKLELPSSHSISCVLSCRPFVTFVTSSAEETLTTKTCQRCYKVTKGLQGRKQLIEWGDGETCN